MPLPTASLHQGHLSNRLFPLTIFGIAMGLLEAIVVVYLRQIYYPEGFSFPLKPMTTQGISLEMLRELCTIVMLITVSMGAGTLFIDRFSFFLYSFGVWDIFYYVWLKVLLDWPSSFLTWDILFLIPVVWTGPVLAPVICSVTMIAMGIGLQVLRYHGYTVLIPRLAWLCMGAGAALILYTFMRDFLLLIIRGGFLPGFLSLASDVQFQQAVARYIPSSFHWSFFVAGKSLILISLVSVYRHARKSRRV